MLYDQAVRWIVDPANHQRSGTRDDACFRKIVVVRDQTECDTGRDRPKPRDNCGHQHEFDIPIRRDGQQPFARCRVEVLLTEHRIVELCERLGDDRRKFDGHRSWLDAVAFTDEKLILQCDAQT